MTKSKEMSKTRQKIDFGMELKNQVLEKKSKMSQPIRGLGGHLVILIGPKNTNLVEDVEIFPPVKFR